MTEIVAELSGVLYDKLSRTSRPVHLKVKGNAMQVDPGDPPVISGGPIDPYPDIGLPGPQPPGGGWPGDPGYGKPQPPADPNWGIPGPPYPPQIGGGPMPGGPSVTPPIYYPPHVPPSLTPPEPPAAGSPPTPVPPPEGSQGWPVAPIVPPPYIVVHYPGIGPVTVPQPLTAQPK